MQLRAIRNRAAIVLAIGLLSAFRSPIHGVSRARAELGDCDAKCGNCDSMWTSVSCTNDCGPSSAPVCLRQEFDHCGGADYFYCGGGT